MKVILLTGLILFGVVASADACLEPVKNYNEHYFKENTTSPGYTVLKENLLPFVEKRPIDELRTLAYFLVSYLVEGHSLDDSVIDIKEVLKSQPRIRLPDDRLIQGHHHASFGEIKDRETLIELIKFLYIQGVTNGNLKRAVSNFNDLVDCPAFKILKY